jgi:trimeric autotransporter adhesin
MALTATDLFNDATPREIGGVGPDQVKLIVSNGEIASVENTDTPTTGTLTN